MRLLTAVWFIGVICQVLATSANHVLLREYARESNASLLWGPYRSNLYFGVRPRIPKSLLTGLMWYNSDGFEGIRDFRHTCEQGDDMAGYGWEQYDPRSGGRQVIRDRKNGVEIRTEFVKTDHGSWAVRLKGIPDSPSSKTTVVFYAGLEGEGSLDLESQLTPLGIEGAVKLSGRSTELGPFSMAVTEGPTTNKHPNSGHPLELMRPSDNSHYASLVIPDDNVWRAKDVFLTFAQDSVTMLSSLYGEDDKLPPWSVFLLQNRDDLKGNVHIIQKVFEGPFEFDVLYNPTELPASTRITPQSIDDLVDDSIGKFDRKFSKAFSFQPPFDTATYLPFAKELFSNLVGGIGYFHGTSLVDRSYVEDEDEENFWEEEAKVLEMGSAKEEGPYELFTAVPSRPFFPRGFYWDEGFHLIPVLDYDTDLALEIIKSWFALMDDDGWIAREQILGPEARSKVPEEFRTQYPHFANPPTLMLLFSDIARKIKEDSSVNADFFRFENNEGVGLGTAHIRNPELLFDYASAIYPKLQSHFEWFRRSQRGGIREWDRDAFSSKEGYRWRGRTPNHCLTSGLDDYPRAAIPHPGELHIDLLSWMGMMSRSMKYIASVLKKEEDVDEYTRIEEAIIRNIDDLHWDDGNQTYCDVTVDEYEESVRVCHKGYVSLFPFVLKLVSPESPHILPILRDIKDPDQLWSPYGIRSLSKSDEFFGTAENYWRGPVWININYMILDSLLYYGTHEDTSSAVKTLAGQIYKELRENVVTNVYENWKRTGFAWEQYDSHTGKAKGVKHFVGWTSLVVKIMAMPSEIFD
jgi:mannosyl-oligosaccharide glucosidase